MKNKQHIIFDWNGTLVDDAWVFVDVLNSLLGARQLNTITIKEYRAKFCFPIKSFYKKLGVDVSGKSFLKLEKDFVLEYKKRMHDASLFPDVPALLDELLSQGVKLSILSASNQKVLSSLVKYYQLSDHFDYIKGVNNYGAHGKIDSGRELLKATNNKKQDVLLIGDTDYDYNLSVSLQIECVLVSKGHQSKRRLKETTSRVVDSLSLLKIN